MSPARRDAASEILPKNYRILMTHGSDVAYPHRIGLGSKPLWHAADSVNSMTSGGLLRTFWPKVSLEARKGPKALEHFEEPSEF